jgi:hypothetical protein
MIKLKGGSLSSTYLMENEKGKFVRKMINTKDNREYGYMRWYSQLKKLQRYNTDFPYLYPQIIKIGVDGDQAYFDLEYLKTYKDIKTIFAEQELTDKELHKINNAIWNAFSVMHQYSHNAISGAPLLYFKEEVEQKLEDAKKFPKFLEFFNCGTYQYFGDIIHGITNYVDELRNFFSEMKLIDEQSIHGNPTLENMMYSFTDDAVKFVDPYEESVIDTRFLDYAQVLQCSRSCYGITNDGEVSVNENVVKCDIVVPKNFREFNKLFEGQIIEPKTKQIVDVLEATQFIRMLPFKLAAGDIDKAKYFYVHACSLLRHIF